MVCFGFAVIAGPILSEQELQLLNQYYAAHGKDRQVNAQLEAAGYNLTALRHDLKHTLSLVEDVSPRNEKYDQSGASIFLKLVELSHYEDGQTLPLPDSYWNKYSLRGELRDRIRRDFEVRFHHSQGVAGDGFQLIPDHEHGRYIYDIFPDGRYFFGIWYRQRPNGWLSVSPLSHRHAMAVDLHTLNIYEFTDDSYEDQRVAHRPTALNMIDWQGALIDGAKAVMQNLGYKWFLLQSAKNNAQVKKGDLELAQAERYYDQNANRLGLNRTKGDDFGSRLPRTGKSTHPRHVNCRKYLEILDTAKLRLTPK